MKKIRPMKQINLMALMKPMKLIKLMKLLKLNVLFLLATVTFLGACTKVPSYIDDGFSGGIVLSLSQTSLTSSAETLAAGSSVTIRLAVKDQNGNAFFIPRYKPDVVFSKSGGTSDGTFGSVVDSNDGVFTTTFTGTTAGTPILITASIDGANVGRPARVQVTPGLTSLSNFYVILSASTVMAGSSIKATLHTFDALNNPLTTGGLTVAFSHSGGTSTGSFSSVTDNGDGTYSADFTGLNAGTATNISASIGGQSITSTPSIIVSPGAATQLIFITDPSHTQAGSAIGTMLIRAIDAQGNTASAYSGTVTLSIDTNVGGGTLSGTLSGTATAGSISFAGLSIDKSGTGYTLRATGTGGVTSATSNSFNITIGSAGTIGVLSGNNQSAVAGSALGSSLVAVVQDAIGNPVSGATIDWTTTSGTLGSASSATDSSGQASNTLTTSTTAASITVTATIHSTATSTTFSASGTHGAATQIVYTTQPTGGVAQGVTLPTQPVLAIKDANSNTVTTGVDATADVTLSLTSGTGSLGGTLTLTPVAGVVTFSGISVDTQGAGKIITATKASTFFSGGTTSKSVASNSFTVHPPAPGAFTITSSVAGASSVVLTWGTSSNAANYSVRYGTSTGVYGTTFASNATSPTTVTGLTPGTTYYFLVTATNITGSTNATVEFSATPLSAFTITSAAVNASSAVRLTWAASTGATSYTVKYGTTTGVYPTTFSTSATLPTDVTGLAPGTTYYFMITAVNGSGSVDATTEASATAIGAFTISSVSPATLSAVVDWATSTGSTSYDILYDTTSRLGGGTYASSSTGVSSGATISSLAAGTTYYFRVRANGASGTVLSTNEISSAVYQAFTLNIPFTSGTEASYTISDSTRVDLTGGVVRLTPASQTDNSTNTGASAGGFIDGILAGVQWDNTNSYLRLNTTTNNAELDPSWTPQWSSLVDYWKMENNGTDSGSRSNPLIGASYVNDPKVGTYSLSTSGTVASYSGTQTQISFSGWVKVTASGSPNARVIEKGGGFPNSDFSLAGLVSPSIFVNSNACVAGFVNSLGTGVWHHLAFTLDGSNLKAYFDGLLVAATVCAASLTNVYSLLRVGTDYWGAQPWPGLIDDVAIWSTALTGAEIQTIYARQSAKYSGQLTSRVLDAYSSQSWTTLASKTTLPFYKDLPGSSGSESSTSYSSIAGGLMSGLAGLWHLNQASYTGTAGEVLDSSGHGVNGTSASGTPLPTVGALGNGAYFGSGPYIYIPNASFTLDITNTVTTCYWMNTADIAGATAWTTLVGKMNDLGGASKGWTTARHGSNQVIWIRVDSSAGINQGFAGTTAIYDGKNHHICVSFDQGNLKAWIDGKSEISATYLHGTGFIDGDPLRFGGLSGGAKHKGMIDEVAIWNRALSSAEVLELYRRGANRVKYQLRSCAASDCSDQEALTSTYKGWKGPDNTGLSYFSELYNTTNNVLAGIVSTGAPTMTFSNFSGSGLAVTGNRYFQYRAILESDDQNALCNYGSGAVACSPELQAVAVGPTHYDTNIQSIISKSAIGSAYQTLDTNGISETLGANLCSSGAKYSLSSDGTTFYYWDGSAWALSSAYATANDAATMRSNFSSFPASAAGTGTLQIKTYLKSSGTSSCEVDNLQFTGKKY